MSLAIHLGIAASSNHLKPVSREGEDACKRVSLDRNLGQMLLQVSFTMNEASLVLRIEWPQSFELRSTGNADTVPPGTIASRALVRRWGRSFIYAACAGLLLGRSASIHRSSYTTVSVGANRPYHSVRRQGRSVTHRSMPESSATRNWATIQVRKVSLTMVRLSSRPLEFEPFSSVGPLRGVKAAARRWRDGLRPAL